MTILVADVEGDDYWPSKVHVVSLRVFPNGKIHSFTNMDKLVEFVEKVNPDRWAFHNGLQYDVPHLNRLVKKDLIDPSKVLDTFVISRLVDYSAFRTHSLKEIGTKLGVHKGDYTGGFEVYSDEMRTYCEQDVEVLTAILKYFWKYIIDPDWAKSMKLEHEMTTLCFNLHENGFEFNEPKAKELLESVQKEKDSLEDSFKKVFPAKLVEVKRNKLRYTSEKKLYKNVLDDFTKFPKVEVEGEEYIVFDYKDFDPASPKERIEVLWEAGWKPFEKTKGHIKKLRERNFPRKSWRKRK